MKRVITAAVLIPLIVWTVIWAPQWFFLVVIALIGAAAFHEFDLIVGAHGIDRTQWWGIILGVIFLNFIQKLATAFFFGNRKLVKPLALGFAGLLLVTLSCVLYL